MLPSRLADDLGLDRDSDAETVWSCSRTTGFVVFLVSQESRLEEERSRRRDPDSDSEDPDFDSLALNKDAQSLCSAQNSFFRLCSVHNSILDVILIPGGNCFLLMPFCLFSLTRMCSTLPRNAADQAEKNAADEEPENAPPPNAETDPPSPTKEPDPDEVAASKLPISINGDWLDLVRLRMHGVPDVRIIKDKFKSEEKAGSFFILTGLDTEERAGIVGFGPWEAEINGKGTGCGKGACKAIADFKTRYDRDLDEEEDDSIEQSTSAPTDPPAVKEKDPTKTKKKLKLFYDGKNVIRWGSKDAEPSMIRWLDDDDMEQHPELYAEITEWRGLNGENDKWKPSWVELKKRKERLGGGGVDDDDDDD